MSNNRPTRDSMSLVNSTRWVLGNHFSSPRLAVSSVPSYNMPPCEAPMPFSIRPFRRFPVQCFVTYNAGPFLTLPLAYFSGSGH